MNLIDCVSLTEMEYADVPRCQVNHYITYRLIYLYRFNYLRLFTYCIKCQRIRVKLRIFITTLAYVQSVECRALHVCPRLSLIHI